MSETENAENVNRPSDLVQLHLVLPYKFEPYENPKVRGYLDDGYRILQLQRVTDREVVLTLTR